MKFPHSATIQHNLKVGTQYTWTSVSSTPCLVQPLSDEATALYGLTFGKAFTCFLPFTVDVTERMRLVINGTTYGVKGLPVYDYGLNKHKKATLEKV